MNERIGKGTSSSMPLTRKLVKYFNYGGRFSDLPRRPAPSHPDSVGAVANGCR